MYSRGDDGSLAMPGRPALWRPVVALNAVAMTVFVWHMTALLGVLLAFEALGGTLREQVDAGWWAQRPLWLLGPLRPPLGFRPPETAAAQT